MVYLGKIGIFLISILVGSCFLYQPVGAHIHIHVSPYKPNIIYLGRHNRLETGSFPSPPEDPEGQKIYAIVHDAYGQIVLGYLNYTMNEKTWNFTLMKLIYGNLANGTWMGEVPLHKEKVPYTVLYNASFTDDLHYSVSKPGPYYNTLNYTGNDENIAQGKGYPVTDRYVVIDSQFDQLVKGKHEDFTAMISDYHKNTIYDVKLDYKLINDTYMSVGSTPMSLTPHGVENKPNGIIHEFYSTTITIPSGIKEIQFYATLHDSKGYINSFEPQKIQYITKTSAPSPNDVFVKTKVMNVDVDNKTAHMRIMLNGPLINFNYLTNSSREEIERNIGIPDNIHLQLIDNNDNSFHIPASFHNLTQIINPINFSSFHATISYPAPLTGNPSTFPLDHYYAYLTIGMPFDRDVKIHYTQPDYSPLYSSAWDPSPWNVKNSSLTQRETGPVKIPMEFTRSYFFIQTIIFPILFVFFLLGFICVLPTKDHYLIARLTITLGVFAFVFAFESILHPLKPLSVQNVSTFADFLLNLVLVAAIASTISSVIGSHIERMKDKPEWVSRIYQYSIHDALAVAFVLITIVWTRPHSIEFLGLVIIVVVVIGLGYGLIYQIIFQYRSNQRKWRNIRKIMFGRNDLKIEGVSEADLSKAITSIQWFYDDKTSWQLYIDGSATTKVGILYIGWGKFMIVDDKAGGKHVGKLVDASNLYLSDAKMEDLKQEINSELWNFLNRHKSD